MNLYTEAGGLFGTHVTWSDIEGDMQRELNTTASFGPNKSATDIGEDSGFMSKVLLIEPDWQHRDKEVPEKFVVKILTQLALQKLSTEVAGPMNVKNVCNIPEYRASLETRLKKIYHMKKFTDSNPLKGYIIMEHIENTISVHFYELLTPDEVKQILRNTAVLEATSLNFTLEEKSQLTESFKAFYAQFFSTETMEATMTVIRKFENGKFEEKAACLEKIVSDLSDLSRADSLSEECGMDRVLCHGDLWSMNTLWRLEENGLSLAALIDYQAAHLGCAGTDFVRLFVTCLSGKHRRAYWEELLKVFYGFLLEELGGRKASYTLEQLKESYRRFFPIGGFMALSMIGPLFKVFFKYPNEELRKNCLEIVCEKIDFILDDIFYYHDRNTRIRNRKKVEHIA
ncbi:hypothetical protein V3C99_001048 [Haemonchus contortus]